LLTLSRLLDSQGKPIGSIGISKDISQEKKLQRELIQSQKFAAIGQAVTRIQHAIKNMLNSLKGGAYLVRVGMAKDNRERVEDGWVMVEEGIERISSLSYNMLNFAREWKPSLQRVDLSDLVVKICESNRQSAAERGVTLGHDMPHQPPPVLCDPKLIHMAATDLVVNAIDACLGKDYGDHERPEVVVSSGASEREDCVVIEVRDNGCGMTEEVRRHIFTPFFSTKETLGTGLGLAVTSKIIRVHGGDISVESEPDRGTVFRIIIPKDGPPDSQGAG
jgi:signal transduction histidine kinase